MFGVPKIKGAISRIPFKFWIPVYYLLTFLWILVLIVAWPFIFVYHVALSALAWSTLSPGKDVVVVANDSQVCKSWLPRLMPMIEKRAIFLNYEERHSWRRWSLPVRLFHAFGPAPTAPTFIPHSLPAVIVIRRFRQPQLFSFGSLSRDREATLERLRSALVAGFRRPVQMM